MGHYERGGKMTPPVTPPAKPTAKVLAKSVAKPQVKPRPSTAVSDAIENEEVIASRHYRLMGWLGVQSIIIVIMSLILVFGMPFFRPIYQYYALNAPQDPVRLTPLTMPNMTNRALLSWATTAVTEIMTIGFGDLNDKLISQKSRFTPEGWDSFVKAFNQQKIGDAFRQNQLVLTTVPSNTPVIIAQGVNSKNIYQWRIQMPVIMTYATNNNISHSKNTVISLDITRVPAKQNPGGLGINTWTINN